MCAEKFEKSKEYSDARGQFDELGMEEQAVFIAESMVNMIVKSVRTAGDAVSKAFEEVKADVKNAANEDREPEAPKKKAKSTKAKAGVKAGTAKKGASKTSSKAKKSDDAPADKSE